MNASLKFTHLLPALLLVGGWLASNHYPPWGAFYNEFLAVLALLVLAMISVAQRQPLVLPGPAALVLLLALVPLVQFGLGLIDFLGDAVIAACYLGVLALSIVVGSDLRRLWGARFVEALAWVCLVGAMASVVLALHQWLGLQQFGVWLMDVPPNGRPYANLGQPNNLATLFCMGVASAIYLRERGQFGLLVMALIALVLFVGIAMTRSRTAILALLVMAVWVVSKRKRLGLRCSVAEVVSGLAVFALLWTGWSTVSGWLHLSAESTMTRLQGTFSGEIRLVLWQQLLDAVWRQPLAGYGWNQVSVAQMAVISEYPNLVPAEYAHNVLIDLLVWNGVPLGGLAVLAVTGWFAFQVRNLDSLESWFALLFVLLLATHSMVELPHAYAYFLIPAGVCVGILSQQQRALISLPVKTYAMFVALSVVMTAWIFVEYQKIEANHRLMRFESIGLEQRAADARTPDVVLLTQLEAFIRFARTEAREGMSEEEIRWMGKVAHRYPFPPAIMRYALALGFNHRPQEASLELHRLKRIQPADRFDEVRSVWPSLVGRYPQLGKVVLPAD